jgi:hypothetical protein
MPAWAIGAWREGAWKGTAWATVPPVQVPDVVGLTQADGTNALEADGFVVAVATAYSSVVQAGLIISQDPAAGSTPGTGATVTITVSLGEAPPASQASGGFFFGFDRHLAERRRRKEREEELKREADEIQAELDREIARLLHEQEARDAERADLARIQALADRYAGTKQPVPRKIAASLLKAQEERTRNSLLQLQREMQQMFEEEEAAVIAVLMMDSD